MKKLLLLTSIACGVLSARATTFQYEANLDGLTESPPNASPATGFAEVNYDDFLHTLTLQITFSGLLGTTTAAHIHAPTASPFTPPAGVATTTPYFAGFPIGVTSGSYNNVLDLTSSSSYNPSFITANGGTTATAEAALLGAISGGRAYVNVHSTVFAGGEISGFLVAVPEPSSLGLLGLGAIALAGRAWRTRRVTKQLCNKRG